MNCAPGRATDSSGFVLNPADQVAYTGPAQVANKQPHMAKVGDAMQLFVDGNPFIVTGGELSNSSSSSIQYMNASVWPNLSQITGYNAMLAAISWEMVERVQGEYDWSMLDALIQQSRDHNVKLVPLWFGAWKNGNSHYTPGWVKSNETTYPFVRAADGTTLTINTPIGEAVKEADAKAFAAMMAHIKEVDSVEHTVIMVQIQNEMGILGSSRDYSDVGKAAWNQQVPQKLIDHLVANDGKLRPPVQLAWEAMGKPTSGTWGQVFSNDLNVTTTGGPWDLCARGTSTIVGQYGDCNTAAGINPQPDRIADDIFMSWYYGQYVEYQAQLGKAEYDIPMFVNAWILQTSDYVPGDYPSGGPLARMLNIYQVASPTIDMYTPDIYRSDFQNVIAEFDLTPDRGLFVPESGAGINGITGLATILGAGGIGFSPFGVESATNANPTGPFATGYGAVQSAAPVILKGQQAGTMQAVGMRSNYDGVGSTSDDKYTMTFGNTQVNIQETAEPGYAIVTRLRPGEFSVVGANVTITFTNKVQPNTGICSAQTGSFNVLRTWKATGDSTDVISSDGVTTALNFNSTTSRAVLVSTFANGDASEPTIECAPLRGTVDVSAVVQPRMLAGKVYLSVSATNDGSVPVSVVISTAYGDKTFTNVAPGSTVSVSINSRLTSVPAGEVTVEAAGTVAGETAIEATAAGYAAFPATP